MLTYVAAGNSKTWRSVSRIHKSGKKRRTVTAIRYPLAIKPTRNGIYSDSVRSYGRVDSSLNDVLSCLGNRVDRAQGNVWDTDSGLFSVGCLLWACVVFKATTWILSTTILCTGTWIEMKQLISGNITTTSWELTFGPWSDVLTYQGHLIAVVYQGRGCGRSCYARSWWGTRYRNVKRGPSYNGCRCGKLSKCEPGQGQNSQTSENAKPHLKRQ